MKAFHVDELQLVAEGDGGVLGEAIDAPVLAGDNEFDDFEIAAAVGDLTGEREINPDIEFFDDGKLKFLKKKKISYVLNPERGEEKSLVEAH